MAYHLFVAVVLMVDLVKMKQSLMTDDVFFGKLNENTKSMRAVLLCFWYEVGVSSGIFKIRTGFVTKIMARVQSLLEVINLLIDMLLAHLQARFASSLG